MPVAVKDVIDVAGLPTRGGSDVPDAEPAARDAPLVTRLREAGAVIIGKTATHELAFGVTTPAAANPWDPARSAGGSSGGSAVAVATGAAFAALGTDTAGSIRLPAAFCGVSRAEGAPRGAADGGHPPARAVDGQRRRLRPQRRGPRARLDRPERRTSRGRSTACGSGCRTRRPTPTTRSPRRWRRRSEVLGGAVPVTVPPWTAWERPRGRTLVAEALDAHRAAGWYPARRERYGAEPLAYLESAERLTDADRSAARQELADLAWRLQAALGAVDVLALPVCPVAAPARDADPRRAARELTPLCGPANAAGLAAASVPCGFTAGGLPIGLQLVGEREEAVLAVARRYQAQTAALAGALR